MSVEPDRPQLEVDERFPSGPWVGYYQQWGTQSRQRLGLSFAGGRVSGGGRDPAGEFHVRGTYDLDSGAVRLSKVYPEYRVEYDGKAGQDGIGGNWWITYLGGLLNDRGHFLIWPDALGAEEAARAEEMAGVGVESGASLSLQGSEESGRR